MEDRFSSCSDFAVALGLEAERLATSVSLRSDKLTPHRFVDASNGNGSSFFLGAAQASASVDANEGCRKC